jgi:hypothetical protein
MLNRATAKKIGAVKLLAVVARSRFGPGSAGSTAEVSLRRKSDWPRTDPHDSIVESWGHPSAPAVISRKAFGGCEDFRRPEKFHIVMFPDIARPSATPLSLGIPALRSPQRTVSIDRQFGRNPEHHISKGEQLSRIGRDKTFISQKDRACNKSMSFLVIRKRLAAFDRRNPAVPTEHPSRCW